MRRSARLLSLVFLAALALGLGEPATAQQQLRISTAGIESDWLPKSLNVFKERLEAAAPGAFNVQVFPNGSLFRQGTEVPALQRGNLEMSTMTSFEVEQQIPELSLFASGYLFRDYDHLAKTFASPIGEAYVKRVADAMGIQILAPMYLGTRHVNLRQARPVRVPADLAGVKLRMPAGPGWLVLGRALGASPTPLSQQEVYLALRTGTIDGQENPLSITRANNFHEVTQQIVLTGHLVQPVFLSMASPVWNKLSAEQKTKALEAARAAAQYNDTNRVRDEGEILEFFRTKGLQVTTPDVAAFQAAAKKAYLESDLAKAWAPGLYDQVLAIR